MDDYARKLYDTDPLFRALVHAKLGSGLDSGESEPDFSALSIDDEIEILREYAITLYKEHKTLKNLFLGSLKVTNKSVGQKGSAPPPKGS